MGGRELTNCNIGDNPVPPQIMNNTSQHPSCDKGFNKTLVVCSGGDVRDEEDGDGKIEFFLKVLDENKVVDVNGVADVKLRVFIPNGPLTLISNPVNCLS